jgi:hypothetical protein
MVKPRCNGQVLAERRPSVVASEVLALREQCAAYSRPALCAPLTSNATWSVLA